MKGLKMIGKNKIILDALAVQDAMEQYLNSYEGFLHAKVKVLEVKRCAGGKMSATFIPLNQHEKAEAQNRASAKV